MFEKALAEATFRDLNDAEIDAVAGGSSPILCLTESEREVAVEGGGSITMTVIDDNC